MRWIFDGDGQWECDSERIYPGLGCHGTWRIQVMDDGSFDVGASDNFLIGQRHPWHEVLFCFSTLKQAQDFCQTAEEQFSAIQKM